MRPKILIWVVTMVTLGSGLVNLFSVIGPSLPERSRYLRELFPLEFVHLSRSLTLLIGFTLAVSSSSRDEYVPLEEAKKLFAAAQEPKRFVLVNASDHRFDGNQEQFFRELRGGLEWITRTEP